jgi:hypothetical protein
VFSRLISCNLSSPYLLELDLADDLKTADIVIRRTTLANAKKLSEIISCIVNEQEHTTMRVISEDEERFYLESLSEREAVFLRKLAAKSSGCNLSTTHISGQTRWSMLA